MDRQMAFQSYNIDNYNHNHRNEDSWQLDNTMTYVCIYVKTQNACKTV